MVGSLVAACMLMIAPTIAATQTSATKNTSSTTTPVVIKLKDAHVFTGLHPLWAFLFNLIPAVFQKIDLLVEMTHIWTPGVK